MRTLTLCIALALCVTLSGCSKPAPIDKADQVGELPHFASTIRQSA